MLARRARPAMYRQVAAELPAQIGRAALAPGPDLSSEAALAKQCGVGRDALRQALALLRAEGLIVPTRGRQSRVRDVHRMEVVVVTAPACVAARMPTTEDRARLDLPDGVAVLVVRTAE